MARKKPDPVSSQATRASSKKAATFAKNEAKKALHTSGPSSKRRSKSNSEVDDIANGLIALTVVGATIAAIVSNIKKSQR